MPELKVAIAGTGLIANVKHIPAWQKLKGAKLAAICDLNLEQARSVAAKFGIPGVYSSFDEMLAKEKPDIVDICTPPKTHCMLAVKAMDAKANCMIEKPMGMSVEECDQIVQAYQRNNVKAMCCHSDLFYLSYMKAREMVESGEIGEFRGMRIFLSTPVDYISAKPDHWGNKLPGGVIGETGPHVVYMTLPFIPEIKEVGVFARKILSEYPWSPFEDYRVELVGEKAMCSITLAYTCTEWLCQVEMIGSKAILRLDMETQSVLKYTRKDLKPKTAAMSQLGQAMQLVGDTFSVGTKFATGSVPSSHDVMCEQFVDCIVNNKRSPVPAEEGRETVRVLGLITKQIDEKYGNPAAEYQKQAAAKLTAPPTTPPPTPTAVG